MPAPKFTAQQVKRVEVVKTSDGQSHRRVLVKLTAAQKKHFKQARKEIEAEFPPKKIANRQRLEIVLGLDQSEILAAVDHYAAEHNLPNRGAVLRVALARLLKRKLAIPHHGWQPGRVRKGAKKKPRFVAQSVRQKSSAN